MKLIDRIHSEIELKSVRDQVGRVINKRLGSALGQRKLDELVAELIGAKDFNTALGIARMAESIPKGVEVSKSANKNEEFAVLAWHSVLKGIAWEGYASEDEIHRLLSDLVDDFVVAPGNKSEKKIYKGWKQQITAIASTVFLSHLKSRLSDMTGIEADTLGRCVDDAKAHIQSENGLSGGDFPFRVGERIVKEKARTSQAAHSSMANTKENKAGWYRVIRALGKQGYADEEDIQEMLDDSVYDFVGSSKWISDNVNNQGWEAQISAIAAKMCLPQLMFRISDLTGITDIDLRRCVVEASAQMSNGSRIKDEFDVRSHVGY